MIYRFSCIFHMYYPFTLTLTGNFQDCWDWTREFIAFFFSLLLFAVRTYRYSRGHLETLHKYEISSHIRVFSFGETLEGNIYVLLAPNNERYVLKIDFSDAECIVLAKEDLVDGDVNTRFVVPSRPLYSGLNGSMACKLFFLDPGQKCFLLKLNS